MGATLKSAKRNRVMDCGLKMMNQAAAAEMMSVLYERAILAVAIWILSCIIDNFAR